MKKFSIFNLITAINEFYKQKESTKEGDNDNPESFSNQQPANTDLYKNLQNNPMYETIKSHNAFTKRVLEKKK